MIKIFKFLLQTSLFVFFSLLSFISLLYILLCHIFFLTLFIISFSYPLPPVKFYYNRPVIYLFFLSSSYYPVSPCAHNHSSPSSYFPIHISVSYYHAPSPPTQFFFSYLLLEISVVFFSFILHLLPLSTCPLFLLLS